MVAYQTGRVDRFQPCDKLDIPPKQDALWTAAELNAITSNLVVGPNGHVHTFGCIQWECYHFNGRPKARCYPFDIQGHNYQNKNPKVHPAKSNDDNSKYSTLYRTLYRILYTTPTAADRLILCGQDCVCLVAPYPFRLEPSKEFDHNADMNITGGG
jgi:hypothetical protein